MLDLYYKGTIILWERKMQWEYFYWDGWNTGNKNRWKWGDKNFKKEISNVTIFKTMDTLVIKKRRSVML